MCVCMYVYLKKKVDQWICSKIFFFFDTYFDVLRNLQEVNGLFIFRVFFYFCISPFSPNNP